MALGGAAGRFSFRSFPIHGADRKRWAAGDLCAAPTPTRRFSRRQRRYARAPKRAANPWALDLCLWFRSQVRSRHRVAPVRP